jgi:predicted nucleic-acid-binding Zn-ribbon protein
MVTHFQTQTGEAACAQRNGMHTAFQKTTDVTQVTCKRCIASDVYQAATNTQPQEGK